MDTRFPTFDHYMTRLEDWYADNTRARVYDDSPGARDPGHVIHQAQPYPGPPWRRLWREATAPPGEDTPEFQRIRAGIIDAVAQELYDLTHSPSAVATYHPHTQEWRLAIASAPGSVRQVARQFGVSHVTVSQLRRQLEDDAGPARRAAVQQRSPNGTA